MVDGAKLRIDSISYAEQLYNNDLLIDKFETPINQKTGEIRKNERKARYGPLTIEIINDRYTYIRGSIHKFHTESTNQDDFNITQIKSAVKKFQILFDLDPQAAKIDNLEFGVNLKLDTPAWEFINSVICMGVKSPGVLESGTTGIRIGKNFVLQQYELKIYDKQQQVTGQEGRVLRIEIRVRKMKFLREIGISNLISLTEPNKIRECGTLLLKHFDNLIILDPILNLESIPLRSDRELLMQGANPYYWEQIAGKISRQAISAKRKLFRAKMLTYCNRDLKMQIRDIISSKIDELCLVDKLPLYTSG